MFKQKGWYLPPNPKWDVTDFGLGDFENYGLVLVNILLLVVGELIHKHGHFDMEISVPAFYALFGFVAYCLIIVGAVLLRKIVRREEDYYDE